MMIRSGSIRDSDATNPIVVDDLNKILAIELRDAKLKDATSLVDAVFPDKYLPFVVDDNLLQSLKSVYGKNGWIEPATNAEPSSADWLNRIGKFKVHALIYFTDTFDGIANALAKKSRTRLRRRWCASNCTSAPKGSAIKRKPDLVLVDAKHRRKDWFPEWKHIRVIGEVTSQPTFHLNLRNQILNKAYIAMNQQDDRRFIIFLSFFNHTTFQITLCDRAGIIHSPAYDIYGDALCLLRVLTGLMFAEEHVLGHDPTIRRGPDDTIIAISIRGVEYQVVKKLFSSSSLRGRATRCWHVKNGEEEFAIKDSWIHDGRKTNEADILREISGIACVPTLIASEDLKHPGDPNITDSTRLYRAGFDYDEVRLHRRILMQPVGESMWSFNSKKELVGAFMDIIASKYAYPYC
jgi:Fungal protein kinase